jgi:hypothetical protein
MMSFLIFQKIKNQLKKQNITLKNKLFFNFLEKKLIIDDKVIPMQMIDIEKVIKTYEQLKDIKEIEITSSKIKLIYKDDTTLTF